MRQAEMVTFGGSGLDRAAALRADAAAQAAMWADPAARVLPVWRGKVLVAGAALGWVAPGHPALAEAGPALFLGQGGDGPVFAVDISDWEPEADQPAVAGGFFDPTLQAHPALPDMGFAELRGVMAELSPRDAELAAMARALFGWHRSHGFCARCGARSDWSDAGWRRECPACGAQHFPRTDPVVIMLILRGNSVLLGRSPAWPEGMYSLLAGFVEPGETIEAAVRREVAEETGVKVGAVRYLASQPWPFPASLMFGCQGEALSEEIEIDPVEIEDAIWVGREEMVQVMAGLHPRIRPARRGAIAHFLVANWLADRLE
ncbi:NAD(+) diphosphatase [Solirhodobacter olei]|uniref:NAD(+) diphosphatase n=1 Tax=Solirhodobacter olei TaxID=2493082 RepID=UPI000FD71113|nr:NAD(+) diphosphatase [Solirhodobacter olei]